MISSGPILTLWGRTSAWQQRIAVPGAPGGAGPLLSTWLHHPVFGTLGIYLSQPIAGAVGLERGRRIKVTARVRPLLVGALRDDPCSIVDARLAPLALELYTIQIANTGISSTTPILGEPASVRVLPTQSDVHILRVSGWPDAVFWQPDGSHEPVRATWNQIFGVVTHYHRRRYLRYVLSKSAVQ